MFVYIWKLFLYTHIHLNKRHWRLLVRGCEVRHPAISPLYADRRADNAETRLS